MKLRSAIYSVALLLVLAGCNSGHDTDSLANRTASGAAQALDCLQCHSSSFNPDLDPLVTNGTGTSGKHDRHVNYLSMPCERCHTGYYWSATHMNGTFDTGNAAVLLVGFDVYNPAGAWTGDTGPSTGNCSSLNCHGSDSPGWYSSWTFPSCSTCHSNPIGLRRAVTGTVGDFASNPSISSHHVSGGADPVNGQCLVCHNLSTHATGTVLLRQADTSAVIIYSSASPSSAEAFCLSCHDAGGALVTFNTVSGGTPTSPFNDGSVMGTAPNRASAEIADQWNKTFGHKQQGLTCIGNGTPNTGCHGNGHGTAYVGLLAKKLTLPYPFLSAPYEVADEGDYELCFNCHQGYPRVRKESIFGVKALSKYDWDHQWGIAPPYYIDYINFFLTGFRDRYDNSGKFYDDNGGVVDTGQYLNLHYYHVQDENWWFYGFGSGSQGGWKYRDSIPSTVHCLTCHNVHGSNTPWGWVHDELLYTHATSTYGDQYGRMGVADLNSLGNYPINCLYNCHDTMGPTHNWFDPSGD